MWNVSLMTQKRIVGGASRLEQCDKFLANVVQQSNVKDGNRRMDHLTIRR